MLFKKYLRVTKVSKKEQTKSLIMSQIPFVNSVIKSPYYISNIVVYAFNLMPDEI